MKLASFALQKAEKTKKGKKSSLTPGGGRFSSDLTKNMNRLNLNHEDTRSSRLHGGGGKVSKLPAAPRATLSDEFASSSDEWDVNSNGGSIDSQVCSVWLRLSMPQSRLELWI